MHHDYICNHDNSSIHNDYDNRSTDCTKHPDLLHQKGQ